VGAHLPSVVVVSLSYHNAWGDGLCPVPPIAPWSSRLTAGRKTPLSQRAAKLHWKLTIEILDLQQIYGVGDGHGAIWLHWRRIAVERSLDPTQHLAKQSGLGVTEENGVDRSAAGERKKPFHQTCVHRAGAAQQRQDLSLPALFREASLS
jgi:hypothetical protein